MIGEDPTKVGARGLAAAASVSVRDATEADFPRILEIDATVFPEYTETFAEFLDRRARLQAGGYTNVFAVAHTPPGRIVGYSNFHHMRGQFDPARFRMTVAVDPAWQRRGVGGSLLLQMLRAAAGHGGRLLESFARESMPGVVAFLEHRGFGETMRTWEYRLDVAGFDQTPFLPYLDRVREAGVVITTLEDECRRNPEALRQLYAMHNAVVADIPAPIPSTPLPFEEFLHRAVESPRALPDAYFLARIGESYVGEADLRRPPTGAHLHHDVTGVLPAYRGRGIAMALKIATIMYARSRGFAEILTWNEAQNAGMIAINERLGFVRHPAWITFERGIAPEAMR